ncbi:MAG: GNAT family N-acetyltransferase [Gammaproteobacteria bacterium]|nr:GNAT family N-acetyltransferase [Gammaproteobacteria bacterium]
MKDSRASICYLFPSFSPFLFRRKGLGGYLLRKILAEATAAGLPVRIHVEMNNPALNLYHHLGFYKTGDTGVYYLMEWHPDKEKRKAKKKTQNK